MDLDAGTAALFLIIVLVPVFFYFRSQGNKNRQTRLMEEIAARQRELGDPDSLDPINAACTQRELDHARDRRRKLLELERLIGRLPDDLQERVRKGTL